MDDRKRLVELCPLCGSAPTVVDLAGWEVICDCGLQFANGDCADRAATVAAWNTRAAESSVAELRAERDENRRAEIEWRSAAYTAQNKLMRANERAERLAEALRLAVGRNSRGLLLSKEQIAEFGALTTTAQPGETNNG